MALWGSCSARRAQDAKLFFSAPSESIHLSIHLSICLSIYLSIYLYPSLYGYSSLDIDR